MKRLLSLLLGMLLLASCTSPQAAGTRQIVPTPLIEVGALSTLPPATAQRSVAGQQLPAIAPTTVFATITQTPSPAADRPTDLPTSTPLPTEPSSEQRFRQLRFAERPNLEPQTSFAVGTEEVYAVWDYDGMTTGDRVRRIWFRDGLIWLVREETWDFARYGTEGTVLDVAIYDQEGSGLEAAAYMLQLYVNEELQVAAGFEIAAR